MFKRMSFPRNITVDYCSRDTIGRRSASERRIHEYLCVCGCVGSTSPLHTKRSVKDVKSRRIRRQCFVFALCRLHVGFLNPVSGICMDKLVSLSIDPLVWIHPSRQWSTLHRMDAMYNLVQYAKVCSPTRTILQGSAWFSKSKKNEGKPPPLTAQCVSGNGHDSQTGTKPPAESLCAHWLCSRM